MSETTNTPCRVITDAADPDLMAFQSAATTLAALAKANGWPIFLVALVPVETEEGQGLAASFVAGGLRPENIAEATHRMGHPYSFGAALGLDACKQCAQLLNGVFEGYDARSREGSALPEGDE